MMVRQRQILSYEDISYDEQVGYGRNAAGLYFRGDAFDQVGDLKEIARAYFESNVHIPGEFPEVRAVLSALIN